MAYSIYFLYLTGRGKKHETNVEEFVKNNRRTPMLNKTNLKAIKMADKFVFSTANGKSTLRCIKKGQFDENEPFAQPDVHHDIETHSEYLGAINEPLIIDSETDPVVETILNSLKDEDEITMLWKPLNNDGTQVMLSLNIERKGKPLQYILAVQESTTSDMQQAA